MWIIQLLGGLAARSPYRAATRFRTRKTASLLAYLAFHCREGASPCPREVLVEMLWPETELDAGRHNLSNALSALRHVMEPPGVQPGTVLLADRAAVHLNRAVVETDVARFEALARRGLDARETEGERTTLLRMAAEAYGGRLLPGFYDEWVTPEAERLAALFLRLTRNAAPLFLAQGELSLLLTCAQRAAADDPWSEEAIQLLMEALAAAGDPSRAVRHYREFEHRLRAELDTAPSPSLQEYAAELRRVMRTSPPTPHAGTERRAPTERTPAPPPAELPAGDERALRGPAFAALTVTRFFDREEDTRRLIGLLQAPRSRLVTLTGTGGTGKTRLALETARRLVGPEHAGDSAEAGRPSSATFLALAELGTGERIPEVLLRSLGIVPQPGRDPLEQAAEALDRESAPLLVLDNFEQLVETGAGHVTTLLARVPHAQCLVTSRQKLLIEGEHELPLAPLPTVASDPSLEALAATPAVQLFVDRAQMVRPDFQLTPRNAAVVTELCAYLEGLPLALELAAARVSLLTPAQILEGIGRDRLDFLVSRRRDVIARHRTLRAALDWSYELLPPDARRFLAQLSVFRGGWTLAAAVTVSASRDEETCLEFLALLRDASLVNLEDQEEGLRFTLLETVRQYAGERLAATGETEQLRRSHACYFLEWAEEVSRRFRTSEHGEALANFERERENLRVALEWSIETGEQEHRARFCVALVTYWKMHGYSEQALIWYADVIHAAMNGSPPAALTERVPSPLLVHLLVALTVLTVNGGRAKEGEALCRWALRLTPEGSDPAVRAETLMTWGLHPTHGGPAGMLTILEESLRLARQARHASLTARVLHYRGFLLQQVGRHEPATEANEEALALFRELDDPTGIADVLRIRGYANTWYLNNLAQGRRDFEENLAIRRRIGDQPGVALALTSLGIVAQKERDLPQAQALYQDAVAIFEKCGWSNSSHNAYVLRDLAAIALEQKQPGEAWSCNRRALGILLQNELFIEAAVCAEVLAGQAVEAGDPIRAARLAGAADRLHPLGGSTAEPVESKVPKLSVTLTGILGGEVCQRELTVGRGLSNAQVLDLAQSFPT